MPVTSKQLIVGLCVALAVLTLTACGGGKTEVPTPEPNVFLAPLPNDRAEMAIATADGVLPCGIAEVEWGFRTFRVNEFPACKAYMPALTVLCLDGSAQWSAVNVSNVDVSTQTNTVAFDVRQEGICGLFPIPAATTPTP